MRNSRVSTIVAEIEALSTVERAALKSQLARFSWWEDAGKAPTLARRLDFVVVFDGGSRGNPGQGYGSFLITRSGDSAQKRRRVELGSDVTSNEAEYDTLLAALHELRRRVASSGLKLDQVSVEVRGDSQLVLRQVGGRWKAREPRMASRRDQVLELLREFGSFRLVEQPREESVRILGH